MRDASFSSSSSNGSELLSAQPPASFGELRAGGNLHKHLVGCMLDNAGQRTRFIDVLGRVQQTSGRP